MIDDKMEGWMLAQFRPNDHGMKHRIAGESMGYRGSRRASPDEKQGLKYDWARDKTSDTQNGTMYQLSSRPSAGVFLGFLLPPDETSWVS
jgi:hypothetical protein